MRTCQLEGYRVEWVSDLVRYDGVDYLRLDGSTDTWMAAVPQAQVLQQLWAGDAEHARSERACLENSCTEMLKDLTQNSLSSVESPVQNSTKPIPPSVLLQCPRAQGFLEVLWAHSFTIPQTSVRSATKQTDTRSSEMASQISCHCLHLKCWLVKGSFCHFTDTRFHLTTPLSNSQFQYNAHNSRV
ncbi:hypothetical protein JZ751_001939 [Albula glossodonta]|uniref:MHC class I-like antigen recognition-like domain-containing protein n=1 Tax=Albula glossodonta TaxID=121402 RepID=A0A8T2P6P1_9TELE|nr:hypothetical protein JZ751_001939 [Albula glossodonta]